MQNQSAPCPPTLPTAQKQSIRCRQEIICAEFINNNWTPNDSGRLRKTPDEFISERQTPDDSRRLWTTLDDSGPFQTTPKDSNSGQLQLPTTRNDSGRLWQTPYDSRRLHLLTTAYRRPSDDSRRLWTTPKNPKRLHTTPTPNNSRRFRTSPNNSERLRATREGSERLQIILCEPTFRSRMGVVSEFLPTFYPSLVLAVGRGPV